MAGDLDGTIKEPLRMMKVKKGEKEEEVPDPLHAEWVSREQQVLSYLLLSISRDILVQVVSIPSAAGVWQAIEGVFASQSRARVINTRMALETTQKGNMTVIEYVTKMCDLTDEMASTGKRLDDEDLVSYILTGLDLEFNPLVSAVATRVEPITVGELISQMTSFEQRMGCCTARPSPRRTLQPRAKVAATPTPTISVAVVVAAVASVGVAVATTGVPVTMDLQEGGPSHILNASCVARWAT